MAGSNPAWIPANSCATEQGRAGMGWLHGVTHQECLPIIPVGWEQGQSCHQASSGTGRLQLGMARMLQGCVRVRKVAWEHKPGQLPLHPPGSFPRVRLEGTTEDPLLQPPCSSRASIWDIIPGGKLSCLEHRPVPVNEEKKVTRSL